VLDRKQRGKTMSDILNVPAGSTSAVVETAPASYIDWAAVIAGALVGIAIVATLTAFGSAVGLSLASPHLGRGSAAYGAAVAIAIWTMWVIISGHVAAGYIAGRMRHMTVETSPDEAEIRNGSHGLVAWAITTIVVTVMVAFAVLGADRAIGSAAARQEDHPARVADRLLHGEQAGAAYNEGLHREVAAILRAASHTGKVTGDDKAYLVGLASHGTVRADAEQRVDAAIVDVKDRADAERKLGVLVGFLTAASLAVGAAAAWWAARIGGSHRLNYRGVSIFTRWR
jgi:hypothetical protein